MVKFSKSELIEHAWEITKKNFWFLVGLAVVMMFISAVPSFFGQANQTEPLVLGIGIILWVVQIFFSIGITYISLKLGRGESAGWADIWVKKYLFWRYIFGSIFYGLVVTIPIVLVILGSFSLAINTNPTLPIATILAATALIIATIFLSIKFQFFTYSIIDKDMGILDAFKASWDLTRGNWWNLLLYNILISLIVLLGFILVIVGIFITLPIAWTAFALVYLKLSDQLPPEKELLVPPEEM
jgi:hypothetical protein